VPGSTNFQQFNPTKANQDTDTQYTTDATRTGGAGVDAIWPSKSANKTLYQASTMNAAFAQMMANKGYVVSDANLATLTAVLANVLTVADIPTGLQSVPWSAIVALNAGLYGGFEVSLTGNTTLSITGQAPGDVIALFFAQDGTGGHTVTFSSAVVGGIQPDPSPNVVSGQLFKVNAADKLQALGPAFSVNGLNGVAIGSVTPSTGAFTDVATNTCEVATSLTAPTVSSGDNSTKVVTTGWAKFGFAVSLGSTGYLQLPTWLGGVVLQWGIVPMPGSSGSDNPTSFSFPLAFPNACFVVVPGTYGGTDRITFIKSFNSTGGVMSNNGSGVQASYIAVGN